MKQPSVATAAAIASIIGLSQLASAESRDSVDQSSKLQLRQMSCLKQQLDAAKSDASELEQLVKECGVAGTHFEATSTSKMSSATQF